MENSLHKAVARQYAEQIQKGLIPDIGVAAQAIGYKPKSGSHIIKTDSFQKELFYVLPYDVIARIQHKQATAWQLKTLKLSKDCDVDQLCKDHDFVLVDKRQTQEGFTIVIKIPDWESVDKALDKIYKLNGMYKAEKHELVRPLDDLTDKELYELVKQDQDVQSPQPEAIIVEST